MSKDNADGTVETPTVEELQSQLSAEKTARESAEEAKAKAENKIVEMKKTTTKHDDNGEDDEIGKTKKILKDMGFATMDELEDFKKFQSDMLSKEEQANNDKVFDEFSSKFNTLDDNQKTILKDLKKVHTDKSYDDILKMTNFIDQSLLEKSKTTQVMGGDNIGLSQPEEKQTLNPKIAKKMNFKSTKELSDVRSKFNI